MMLEKMWSGNLWNLSGSKWKDLPADGVDHHSTHCGLISEIFLNIRV